MDEIRRRTGTGSFVRRDRDTSKTSSEQNNYIDGYFEDLTIHLRSWTMHIYVKCYGLIL